MRASRAAGCEPDKWTAVTEDGKNSAHFEHTVAMTANGPWVLTTAVRSEAEGRADCDSDRAAAERGVPAEAGE